MNKHFRKGFRQGMAIFWPPMFIGFLLLLVSCGKPVTQAVVQQASARQENIRTAVFFNTNPNSAIQWLDFSRVEFEEYEPVTALNLACTGFYGAEGVQAAEVPLDSVVVIGDVYSGEIRFGHLARVGAFDPACNEFSAQSFSYSVHQNMLTLCNMRTDVCESFKAN